MNAMINRWGRRKFLRGVGSGLALAAAARWCGRAEGETTTSKQRFLQEYGFWEYTTPGAGGFEAYDYDDYMLALDDMAQAGMNSLMIVVKWFTTGYRSKLPYLDQLPGVKVIESDNALLRKVIVEAQARRVKVWLGAVTTWYDADKFGSTPRTVARGLMGCPFNVGNYDWYMEAGVTYPKSLGMNVYCLPRGVMTWLEWKDRQRLERSWAQDVADVLKFQPQNLWWFGAGSKKDGIHTRLSVLKQMGYADDVAARRALLNVAAPLRAAMAWTGMDATRTNGVQL